LSVELECGGGLLLLRHVMPLTRRDVVYFYSGAHTSADSLEDLYVIDLLDLGDLPAES